MSLSPFVILAGIVLIYLKAVLCAAITLLISTFASSWIFTIIVSVLVYVIGHVQPVARAAITENAAQVPKILESLFWLVAVLVPDLSALSLVDDIVVGNPITWMLFSKTAALGGIYIGVYFLVSYLIFGGKEL